MTMPYSFTRIRTRLERCVRATPLTNLIEAGIDMKLNDYYSNLTPEELISTLQRMGLNIELSQPSTFELECQRKGICNLGTVKLNIDLNNRLIKDAKKNLNYMSNSPISDLRQALIDNEKTNYDFGIDYKTLSTNPECHNWVFYDKWGIPWRYANDILYYNEKGFVRSKSALRTGWAEADMDGAELPYKSFFTLKEFETIKPGYL